MMDKSAPVKAVDVLIVGGGVCGVLAAHRCNEKSLSYCLIERQSDFGGVWASLANEHSHLQAFEAMYRWHGKYPLGPKPLAKISGPAVLQTLRRFARDADLYKNTFMDSSVLSINFIGHIDRFVTKIQDKTGIDYSLHSTYLIVTPGILTDQHTLQERGICHEDAFTGCITYAGQYRGAESAAGSSSVCGKVVVVLGTGAFACEAMEACLRKGAKHVYLLSRERTRWVLPFSRQFSTTFVSYIPFLPWRWKMALLKTYLSSFYKSAGLLHMMPTGDNMDYTGQCNDGFFQLSKKKAVTFILDNPVGLSEMGVMCKSGKVLSADMLVNATGCKFNTHPKFLQALNTGFDKLYNYAFLGPSGRIGTASDFVYAFVPHGPKKQLDLVFHAIKCHQRGLSRELQSSLRHTPIAPREGSNTKRDTWFTTTAWHSTVNTGMKNLLTLEGERKSVDMQERNILYARTMNVGTGFMDRVWLWSSLAVQQTSFWLLSGCLAIAEIFTLRIL